MTAARRVRLYETCKFALELERLKNPDLGSVYKVVDLLSGDHIFLSFPANQFEWKMSLFAEQVPMELLCYCLGVENDSHRLLSLRISTTALVD